MALVNQDLVLDVVPGPIPTILHLTEYDENMEVVVTLQRRGQPFQIPTGTTVKIEGTLKGHPFSEDGTPSGNTVTFMVSKSMTAYSGRAWTKIKLTKDDKPVSTCGFWLDCDRAGVEADTVIGASGFEEQIKQAAEDWLEDQGFSSPTVSITDIEGGHRVTFTDAQHPQGQSIDVMDGETTNIDATLTREGYAADAKATGDAVSQIPKLNFSGEWVDGQWVQKSGSIASISGYSYYKIPVNLLTPVDFTCQSVATSYAGLGWYDSSMGLIGVITFPGAKQTVTIPETAKYICVTCKSDSKEQFAYSFAMPSGLLGAMLLQLDDSGSKTTEQYSDITFEDGKALLYTGTIGNYAGFKLSEPLPIPGGAMVAVSGYGTGLQNGAVGFLNENGTVLYAEKYKTDPHFIRAPEAATHLIFTTKGALAPSVYYTFHSAAIASASALVDHDWFYKYVDSCICVGDSVTDGRGADKATESYPVRLAEMTGWNVTKAGVEGASTTSWYKNEFAKYNFADYDVCIMEFGLNGGFTDTLAADVEAHDSYEDYADTHTGNYCRMIEMIREQNPNILLVMVHSPNFINASNVIYDIAERYGILLIDLLASRYAIVNPLIFTSDKIHLNAKGYYIKAASILKGLNKVIYDNPAKVTALNS